MKYYIGEYWAMMNSGDLEKVEEGKIKFVETAKKYGPYFESIKNKLPKKFTKEFDKNSWFHDFTFESINVFNITKGTSTIEFIITHDPISYKITLSGVTDLMINIPSTKRWLCGKLTWGYSEFELNDDGTWIISILCDIDCEVIIHFKKIDIEKL